ncbi:hypothetical protein CC80DRAFT_231902 [Byssothecium circinans]|uniref:Secreted protein n=1 Tax=Byssothecium circinans TaxID=147558 RepID=A0A6A5UA12_9PLEO|nr:hypothetical protein CC80DRAFT_231902 [Byssothecium circinans]
MLVLALVLLLCDYLPTVAEPCRASLLPNRVHLSCSQRPGGLLPWPCLVRYSVRHACVWIGHVWPTTDVYITRSVGAKWSFASSLLAFVSKHIFLYTLYHFFLPCFYFLLLPLSRY